jgi:phage terminase small subunit
VTTARDFRLVHQEKRAVGAGAPTPPAHLRPDTRAWWREVVARYELEPQHLRLLRLAAEAWDRANQARRILAKRGLTYRDRFGQPRARPEVAIERDARMAFARLLRELDLEGEPNPGYRR